MTDHQFEILDELYFVISFSDLKQKLSLKDEELIEELRKMIDVNWVKCFLNNIEIPKDEVSYEHSNFKAYHFLATKKGLFAHNSR